MDYIDDSNSCQVHAKPPTIAEAMDEIEEAISGRFKNQSGTQQRLFTNLI